MNPDPPGGHVLNPRQSSTAQWLVAPHPAPPALSFDANNRIAAGVGYDAAGELTSDGTHTYQYDAVGRLTGVDGGATASYAYNAQGQREHTVVNGVTREYVSGRAGEARTVFAGPSQLIEGNVYAGGRDLATYAGGTTYFDHADGLGTVRGRSNLSGGVVEAYTSLPYGGWLNQVGTVSALHFTGKQFDGETSLTYFSARFQSGYSGRFMTPDWAARPKAMPYANVENPQSLNLYTYVLNNHVTATDPDGHWCVFGKLGTTCATPAPPPVAAPPAPPIAELTTSIHGNTTTFQSYSSNGGDKEVQIPSLVKVDSHAKPGAGGPFESTVVGVSNRHAGDPSYGPAGAFIDVGDPRGRDIHGGGHSLGPHAFDPYQQLRPTMGCTRACNADVIRLGSAIEQFQHEHPQVQIPYLRIWK
ncbi:MAG TPA: RHS repeat-associated core domain-containing protein [Terriglobales bacterium]|nr:RHS repeat-associated core domain-containing protein [Terriglobales bacterium]